MAFALIDLSLLFSPSYPGDDVPSQVPFPQLWLPSWLILPQSSNWLFFSGCSPLATLPFLSPAFMEVCLPCRFNAWWRSQDFWGSRLLKPRCLWETAPTFPSNYVLMWPQLPFSSPSLLFEIGSHCPEWSWIPPAPLSISCYLPHCTQVLGFLYTYCWCMVTGSWGRELSHGNTHFPDRLWGFHWINAKLCVGS